MRQRTSACGLFGIAVVYALVSFRAIAAVDIIFDADIHSDCGDAGAQALLLALADAGEANILACMCNTNSYYSVGCIDAINTYYGRPDIPIGATLIDTPPGNPVREIYKMFLGSYGLDRASWDQTAVLYAVKGAAPYWTTVSTGYCHVYSDGTNEWMATPDAEHEYLVGAMSDAEIAAVIEAYMSRSPDSNRPVPSFTATATELAVSFDASSSVDADGAIVSYQWTFGDGTDNQTELGSSESPGGVPTEAAPTSSSDCAAPGQPIGNGAPLLGLLFGLATLCARSLVRRAG